MRGARRRDVRTCVHVCTVSVRVRLSSRKTFHSLSVCFSRTFSRIEKKTKTIKTPRSKSPSRCRLPPTVSYADTFNRSGGLVVAFYSLNFCACARFTPRTRAPTHATSSNRIGSIAIWTGASFPLLFGRLGRKKKPRTTHQLATLLVGRA